MKDFKQLIFSIENAHRQLQASAANAINTTLTVRNWIIGYYIIEFEQNGLDRASYGDKLIVKIAERLKRIKGIDERSLRRFRQFYLVYPQLENTIRGTLSPELNSNGIWGTLSPELIDLKKGASESPVLENNLQISPYKILSRLSYSHLELLMNINEELKRTFYELECIKGIWSVRELKRQINSQYYERCALSASPEKLTNLTQQKTAPQNAIDIIKNIYSFEFLDINTRPIVEESDLETALIDNIQTFILELGYGFCFEARQKRILIGKEYYFIDLVFYHRILKCHVLIDLKIGAFEHGDIGQLNTYVNYFKMEVCEKTDKRPIGILMVAEKDHALVKYATAGMDEDLFVKQYLINLPSPEQIKIYIENELKRTDR